MTRLRTPVAALLVQDDHELRAIGMRPAIGHGDDADLVMSQFLQILVCERASVDRPSALSLLCRSLVHDVTALRNEIRHDSARSQSAHVPSAAHCARVYLLVELAALVAEAHLARAQCAEVLRCARVHIVTQLDDEAADALPVDGYVHEALGALLKQALAHLGAVTHLLIRSSCARTVSKLALQSTHVREVYLRLLSPSPGKETAELGFTIFVLRRDVMLPILRHPRTAKAVGNH